MANPILKINILDHAKDLPIPTYATGGSSGLDLRAAILSSIQLVPGGRELIPTGIAIELPTGYEGQIRGRSGLAIKSGIGLPNSPGTIDNDYRGEVKVILINWSNDPFTISRGDRIAQLVICPVQQVDLLIVDSIRETERSAGGFGHSGIK